MFGISLPELLVVAVIALLVFGPEKLPQIASQLGKISFQLKRTSDTFRREFYNSVYKPVDEEKQNISGELKVMQNNVKSLASVELSQIINQQGKTAENQNENNQNDTEKVSYHNNEPIITVKSEQ